MYVYYTIIVVYVLYTRRKRSVYRPIVAAIADPTLQRRPAAAGELYIPVELAVFAIFFYSKHKYFFLLLLLIQLAHMNLLQNLKYGSFYGSLKMAKNGSGMCFSFFLLAFQFPRFLNIF